MNDLEKNLLIGLVGPCGSGKSTLMAGLEKTAIAAGTSRRSIPT
ncbi:hypothetical protein [Candidatus Villigracilis proximus]